MSPPSPTRHGGGTQAGAAAQALPKHETGREIASGVSPSLHFPIWFETLLLRFQPLQAPLVLQHRPAPLPSFSKGPHPGDTPSGVLLPAGGFGVAVVGGERSAVRAAAAAPVRPPGRRLAAGPAGRTAGADGQAEPPRAGQLGGLGEGWPHRAAPCQPPARGASPLALFVFLFPLVFGAAGPAGRAER